MFLALNSHQSTTLTYTLSSKHNNIKRCLPQNLCIHMNRSKYLNKTKLIFTTVLRKDNKQSQISRNKFINDIILLTLSVMKWCLISMCLAPTCWIGFSITMMILRLSYLIGNFLSSKLVSIIIRWSKISRHSSTGCIFAFCYEMLDFLPLNT